MLTLGLHTAYLGTPYLSWKELSTVIRYLPPTAKLHEARRDEPGKAPYQTPHSQLLFMILDELRNLRAGIPFPESLPRLYDDIMGLTHETTAEGEEPIEQAEESIRDKITRIRQHAKEQT